MPYYGPPGHQIGFDDRESWPRPSGGQLPGPVAGESGEEWRERRRRQMERLRQEQRRQAPAASPAQTGQAGIGFGPPREGYVEYDYGLYRPETEKERAAREAKKKYRNDMAAYWRAKYQQSKDQSPWGWMPRMAATGPATASNPSAFPTAANAGTVSPNGYMDVFNRIFGASGTQLRGLSYGVSPNGGAATTGGAAVPTTNWGAIKNTNSLAPDNTELLRKFGEMMFGSRPASGTRNQFPAPTGY